MLRKKLLLFIAVIAVVIGIMLICVSRTESYECIKTVVDMTEMGDEVPVEIAGFRENTSENTEFFYVLGDQGNLYVIEEDREAFILKAYMPDAFQDKKIADIAKGAYHMAALDSNGMVYTWGSNSYGQLGNKNADKYVRSAQSVEGISDVDKIYAGHHMTALLKGNSSLYVWGAVNTNYQKDMEKNEPLILNVDFSVSKVVDVDEELFILSRDMELWHWKAGELEKVNMAEKVDDIDSSGTGFLLRTVTGQIYIYKDKFLEEGYENVEIDGLSFTHIAIPDHVHRMNANSKNAVVYTDSDLYYIWGVRRNTSFLGFTSLEIEYYKNPVPFKMEDVKEYAVIGYGNIGVIDKDNRIIIYRNNA
ncbi:MAG: hypothetical protein HDR71_15980 [Lachnospiraceae bacterium]|nr:hypothetical protein [Lachnospiraceae bacterium]